MASTQTRTLDIASLPDLPTPCFVPIRYRPGNLGTWSGHLAFAHDLIADRRPSLLVELGTHWGESYFTFCQSIFQNRVNCVCYAVDHWLGEPHAGHYGEEVFEDVQRFNEMHYRGFSYLLRMSFSEALAQFADGSIDLLHIDGLHTYEAVSEDFQTWLPKVKPGGIILMHDIAVRHADFGVWRLWDEVKAEFPRHFAFHHWWGLGVLQKPGGSGGSALLDSLFDGSAETTERIRRHYLMQTAFLENTQGRNAKSQERAQAEIRRAGTVDYSEDSSLIRSLECNQWVDLSFPLPNGTGSGPLQLNPADCFSVIEISRMELKEASTGRVLFRASEPDHFHEFQFSEWTLAFRGNSACNLLSCSHNPSLILPAAWQWDAAVRLEISMHVQTTPNALLRAFQLIQQATVADSEEKLAQRERQVSEANAQAERMEELLAATTVRLRQEMQRENRIWQELLANAEDRVREEAQKAKALPPMEEELRAAKAELERERNLLVTERSLRQRMLNSKSWVITKPLRGLMRRFNGGQD